MREYMTEEYKKNLIGNTFQSSDSEFKQCNGLKVIDVIRELTEEDYDRELIDDTDKNEKGESRYLINTMYKVRLKNNEVITVYEDEINPEYTGSWEHKNKRFTEKDENGKYKLVLKNAVEVMDDKIYRWNISESSTGSCTITGDAVDKFAQYENVKETLRTKIRDLKKSTDYPHNFKGQMVEDFEYVLKLLD